MKKIISFIIPLAALFIAASCKKDTVETLRADFTADRTEITIGESVTFTDLSEGTPSKWEWSFEGADVRTAVTSSPIVKYSTPGTFGVTLKVTRNGISDTKEMPAFITVNYPGTIVADFKVENTTVTDETEVQFTDLSTGSPNQWEWTIKEKGGKTVTSTEQNPKFKLDAGIYSVKLVASSPVTSDTEEKVDYLTVISTKTIAVAISAKSRLTYAGGSVSFTDASMGSPTSWSWTFEGGTPATSTAQNPTVTYAAAGTYKVTLKASNGGSENEKTFENFVRVISAEDIVAIYPFNGDSNDYGPNAINLAKVDVGDGGTINLTAESHDGTGSSAYFESESTSKLSYFRSDDAAITSKFDPTKDFSYSLWAKFPEGFNSNATFFLMGRGANATADGKNGQVMSRFQYNPSAADKNFTFLTRDQLGVNVASWCQYTGKVTNNEWHHFVCISKVVEQNRINYIYIDGAKVVENSVKNHTVQAAPFLVGTGYAFVKNTDNWQYQDRFLGSIDEFIIYNRAISEGEISTLLTY